jgi:two-component system cell cycle response regulator
MKILVVEDQPLELKLVTSVLSAAGHDVERADAAEHALAAIRENLPDVIVLDLALPRMDGLSLARRLKTDPVTRSILIVAVTSHPEEFTQAAAMAAGCDAYLPKPLSTRTLPHVLIQLMSHNSSESS